MLIVWIAILTLFDIIATGVGVSLGIIEEGNPIIAGLLAQSPLGSLIMVALVVGAALWLVESQIERFCWIRYAMFGVLAVKLGVVGLHLYWIGHAL